MKNRKDVVQLCRCRMGNPKKQSRFVCLKCMKIGISGIQRKSQREKFHVKDLFCCTCQEETKHVEIRYCDWIDEVMQKAEELHREYYSGKVS